MYSEYSSWFLHHFEDVYRDVWCWMLMEGSRGWKSMLSFKVAWQQCSVTCSDASRKNQYCIKTSLCFLTESSAAWIQHNEHTYETTVSLMLQIWQASVFSDLTQPHTCLDNSLSPSLPPPTDKFKVSTFFTVQTKRSAGLYEWQWSSVAFCSMCVGPRRHRPNMKRSRIKRL